MTWDEIFIIKCALGFRNRFKIQLTESNWIPNRATRELCTVVSFVTSYAAAAASRFAQQWRGESSKFPPPKSLPPPLPPPPCGAMGGKGFLLSAASSFNNSPSSVGIGDHINRYLGRILDDGTNKSSIVACVRKWIPTRELPTITLRTSHSAH